MLRGAVEILPLAFSAAAYGLAFGVFSAEAGFSAAEITLMSITVFAGTSQIAAVDSFSASQAIWGSVLAAAVLNLRYIGIMATMPSILNKAPWVTRLLAIHLTADENWAQTLTARQSDAKVGVSYHVGAGGTLLVFWIVATCLGNLLGAALPAWSSAAVGFIHGRFYRDVNRHGAVALWHVAGASLSNNCAHFCDFPGNALADASPCRF